MGRKAYRVLSKTAGLPKCHTIFGPGFFVGKIRKGRWKKTRGVAPEKAAFKPIEKKVLWQSV